MQPSTREMQVRNISLQDIQNNQQIQNHQIQQGSSFDHQTHDDFLDQMLSNLPASWSELKSPWDLHPQNPIVNTSSATHNNNNNTSDNHHHKLFNIPIGGGNKPIDLSEDPSGSQQDNHLHHYPCDESTVLASRLRQHQISGNSPKSMILQQQLLISGASGGGVARTPSSTSVIGGDSVLFPLPLTLGSGESSDDVPFKSSNPNGEGSVPGLFNGITGTLPRPNQSGNQQHFLHPQAGSMSAPNFGSQSTGLNQVPAGPSAGGGGGTAPTRQKVRARRGQATDPHSIAERLRRERIAERMKALQELVPNANKTDKASMLDEIIDYVKFLQLQVKVLSMSRLGGAAALAPLVADISSEGGGGDGVQGGIGRNSNGNQNETTNDSLTVTEHQVAKLMEEDMGSAMQYLQGKGLCLMPISLATAISTATSHSRNPTNNNIMTNPLLGSNLDGSSSPNLSVLTAQSAAMASGVGGGSGGGGETSVKD